MWEMLGFPGQGWLQLEELFLAFVLSALVGLEREMRQKGGGATNLHARRRLRCPVKDHTISVFQIRKNPAKPLDDVSAQYHYVGTAPQV